MKINFKKSNRTKQKQIPNIIKIGKNGALIRRKKVKIVF